MATRRAGTTQSLRVWRPEVPERLATRNLRAPPKETPSTTRPIGWSSNWIMAERIKKQHQQQQQQQRQNT